MNDFSVVENSLNHISAYEQRINDTLDLHEADQTIYINGKFAEYCLGEVAILHEQFSSRRNCLTLLNMLC
jgi:hypothetical protein